MDLDFRFYRLSMILTFIAPSLKDFKQRFLSKIVKNISKQSIRLTNGLGAIFAYSLEGCINSSEAKPEHNIVPGKTVVYEIVKPPEALPAVKVCVSVDVKITR